MRALEQFSAEIFSRARTGAGLYAEYCNLPDIFEIIARFLTRGSIATPAQEFVDRKMSPARQVGDSEISACSRTEAKITAGQTCAEFWLEIKLITLPLRRPTVFILWELAIKLTERRGRYQICTCNILQLLIMYEFVACRTQRRSNTR